MDRKKLAHFCRIVGVGSGVFYLASLKEWKE